MGKSFIVVETKLLWISFYYKFSFVLLHWTIWVNFYFVDPLNFNDFLFVGWSANSHVLFFSIILISSSIAFTQTSCFDGTSKFSGSNVGKLQVSKVFDKHLSFINGDSGVKSSCWWIMVWVGITKVSSLSTSSFCCLVIDTSIEMIIVLFSTFSSS